MTAFFNLGALALGIAAWVLPVSAMRRKKREGTLFPLSVVSFSACALALVLQLFEFRQRVRAEDWSALLDTIDATAGVCVLLVAGTVILNILAARKKCRQSASDSMKGLK